jgi:hypothetical protein
MAIYEDLVFFLKNGRFENINFGITKKEFVDILGKPEFENPPGNSVIRFEYDDSFEFYFVRETWKELKTERFSCVVFRPRGELKNSVLQFNSYNWSLGLSLGEGLSFLNENNIRFEEIPYFEKDYRQFKTEGNVTVGFIDEKENGNFTFYKISREVELSPLKPPTKQLSFEIEEVYYEQLRKEAEKTRISIANLCREIIEKHLEDK